MSTPITTNVNFNRNRNVRRKRKPAATRFVQTKQPIRGRLTPRYTKFLSLRRKRINNMRRLPPRMQAQAQRRTINPYIHCRLNPLESGNSIGIPDQSDAKRLAVDHRQITSFKIGSSGAFNIVISATIPQIIWYQTLAGDSTFQVNGYTPSNQAGNTNVYFTVPITTYQDLTVTRYDAAGQYNNQQVYLDANKARIVTVGYRLIYTGSTMNNSGSIMINRQGFSIQPAVGNGGQFTILNGHGSTNLTFNEQQVLVHPSTSSFDFEGMGTDTVRMPLRQGACGLLKHAGPDYKWCDVTDNETYICMANDDKHSILAQGPTSTGDRFRKWPVIAFTDTEWSPAAISIRGATQGQTFDIETVYCIEYAPAVTSQAISLAKQPVQPDMKAVNHASEAARKMPLAGALGMLESAARTAAVVAPLLL